jgi:hypothetical protein
MGQQYVIDGVVSITIDVVEMYMEFDIEVDIKLFQYIQEQSLSVDLWYVDDTLHSTTLVTRF